MGSGNSGTPWACYCSIIAFSTGIPSRSLFGGWRAVGKTLACSRLSDSGEDAKIKGTRRVLPFYFCVRTFSIQRTISEPGAGQQNLPYPPVLHCFPNLALVVESGVPLKLSIYPWVSSPVNSSYILLPQNTFQSGLVALEEEKAKRRRCIARPEEGRGRRGFHRGSVTQR